MREVLLPKQKIFCEEYVKSGHDANKAARAAGYTNIQICRNMLSSNKKIKRYIGRLEETVNAVTNKVLAYTSTESFQELRMAQKLALRLQKKGLYRGRVVDMGDAPDLTNFIKAEELKGKLAGLYTKEEEDKKPTTIMNIIRYPGSTGKPVKMGKDVKEKK